MGYHYFTFYPNVWGSGLSLLLFRLTSNLKGYHYCYFYPNVRSQGLSLLLFLPQRPSSWVITTAIFTPTSDIKGYHYCYFYSNVHRHGLSLLLFLPQPPSSWVITPAIFTPTSAVKGYHYCSSGDHWSYSKLGMSFLSKVWSCYLFIEFHERLQINRVYIQSWINNRNNAHDNLKGVNTHGKFGQDLGRLGII